MSTKEIRKHINLLESSLNESTLRDALDDLYRESGGTLDNELAQEIADDYGIPVEQLLGVYPEFKDRQDRIKSFSPEEKENQRKAGREKEEKEIPSKVNPEHAKEVSSFVKTINTPVGFEREEGEGHIGVGGESYGGDNQLHIKLKSNDIEIIINVHYEEETKYPQSTIPAGISVAGHTNFKTPTGWRTFSRRGIDDSFQFDHFDRERGALDINKLVSDQIQKAEKAREKSANNVVVPGLPGEFTIDPETIPEITAKLQAGKIHQFMPGGMGTGYTLSTKPLQSRIGGFDPSPQGSQELADFFGVQKIYITSFDAD